MRTPGNGRAHRLLENPGCGEAEQDTGARRGDPLNKKHDVSSVTPVAVLAVRRSPALALMPFARVIALACVAVGSTALLGWWLSIPLLHSLLPRLGTMKPNTALCFVLSGVSSTLR